VLTNIKEVFAMNSKKPRKQYSPGQKVSIIREHLLEQRPVSEICDRYNLNPTVFYRWQKEFFEGGHRAFERQGDSKSRQVTKKLERAEAKLQHKDGIIAELLSDHLALKKSLGED
jgi:transposase